MRSRIFRRCLGSPGFVGSSPNQVLAHAARAAARQLNSATFGGRARRALVRASWEGNVESSPNQVLTHAARAAARQPPLVAARGAREGLWLEQRREEPRSPAISGEEIRDAHRPSRLKMPKIIARYKQSLSSVCTNSKLPHNVT